MKDSFASTQSEPLAVEQLANQLQHLKTIEKGLLLGWGSILTFIITALSTDVANGFGRSSALLWLMLLFAPGIGALFIWKWPTWQEVPAYQRRSVILSGLALSWATYLSLILFLSVWNSASIGFITVCSGIGVVLGLALLFAAKRLHKEVIEDGEFFP
jgi:hypothetical protein